ncbi:hypothetical protein Cme02nite_45070 [Catellatospora methionotrophica]|uniref:Uncharacterized protein n=1 Tax=Catellatospora methionotrophica TaxID=121620 RepID=A0A8J3LCE2_9ACTN|nr:DNA primase [Catellatospora methionotrophica]GIG16175.1 hypothetical protein Cme02nite_45070 [Catellatospora methionotrophica]
MTTAFTAEDLSFDALDTEPLDQGAHRDHGTPQAQARRTWRPVDLDDVLSGRYVAPRPTVGRRDDGVGLFYPGRVHSIASESEAGKTWFALIAAREEIEALTNAGDLAEVLGDLKPTLAILDGVTEAMSMHGLELKDNTDVARFGKLLPRAIAEHGPAAVALDHVVKNAEGRGRYAIGGVHKLNGINGAAYVLENRTPFGIGRTGRSTVYVAKDRPGQLRKAALPSAEGLFWLTTMEIISHDETFVETSLVVPASNGERPRPTALMQKISDALAGAGQPLTKQGIEDRVTGKATFVRLALAALVDEGYVAVTAGSRGSLLHSLKKPFGEGERS